MVVRYRKDSEPAAAERRRAYGMNTCPWPKAPLANSHPKPTEMRRIVRKQLATLRLRRIRRDLVETLADGIIVAR